MGVGASVYFVIDAGKKDKHAEAGCDRHNCSVEAGQARLDANAASNAAALSLVVGGLVASTGLAIDLAHQTGSSSSDSARAPALTATAWATPDGAGTRVNGRF